LCGERDQLTRPIHVIWFLGHDLFLTFFGGMFSGSP
jgi:hypothetical protein